MEISVIACAVCFVLGVVADHLFGVKAAALNASLRQKASDENALIHAKLDVIKAAVVKAV